MVLMAAAALNRKPVGGEVSRVFTTRRAQWGSHLLYDTDLNSCQWEKAINCIGNSMKRANKCSHWLLVLTSVTTNKESYMCVYMNKRENNMGAPKVHEHRAPLVQIAHGGFHRLSQ